VKVLLTAGLAAAVLTAAVSAQIVTYDGSDLPEDAGWSYEPRLLPPQRWLHDGWFYSHCSVVFPENCEGQDHFYKASLADYAGAPRLFAEWRVITDGPQSEMVDVAPSSFVLSGQRGITYHYVIARDQVLWRGGTNYDYLFVDMEPGVPHVFRVDLYCEWWYEWTLDGRVIDAGRPEGAYPTEDSVISWGARAACFASTTAYDYIQYGVPKEPRIDCDAIDDFTASCRGGTIKAKLKSSLEPGTELTLTNNGDHRVMRVKPNGKAKAKYKKQTGEHTLLLLNCPAISQEVACE